MTKQHKHFPLSLEAFDAAGEDLKNRMLLDWLSDDGKRAELFERIDADRNGRLTFPSRDAAPREPDGTGYDVPRKPANPHHVPVTLVTRRKDIEEILLNTKNRYSSRVYAELGGGNFMLALDPAAVLAPGQQPRKPDRWTTPAHAEQRQAFGACFPKDVDQLSAIGQAACQAASVMAFRAPEFDLAAFAEQAALRCCQMLMGYAVKDFALLESALRAAYKALVYQVQGRHFVTDLTAIPEARAAMGKLLTRTSALIDAYALADEDALEGCEDPAFRFGADPVLRNLGTQPLGNLNGEQRAIIAVGAAIGMVGNVQAAVCIAVEGLFAQADLLQQALRLARDDCQQRRSDCDRQLQKLIADQLRANPPIPYLPRLRVDENGSKVEELLLALGAGTQESSIPAGEDDPLVWGFPPGAPHHCAGRGLAWPLIVQVVRQVMTLPGLAQALDPVDATVQGLKKLRGFQCLSYPFTHRRDRRRAQSSLNVAMRIRAPVKDNVDHLREVIRAGAPRIERLLRESRHVHFAWFELIEADTVLVLHTVYDGPFGAYLQHFALQAGDLFDVLFEFIEDPPPRPVRKFPDEFAAHLLRYNRAPAMGYFFSAYPRSEVARIVRNEGRGP